MTEPDIEVKEIYEAHNNSEKKAGMVKISDVGSSGEDTITPTGSEKYTNTIKCICRCHPQKKECMECYDHPVHLKKKIQ